MSGVVGLAGWALVVGLCAGACREVDWQLWCVRVVVCGLRNWVWSSEEMTRIEGRECARVAREGNSVAGCVEACHGCGA